MRCADCKTRIRKRADIRAGAGRHATAGGSRPPVTRGLIPTLRRTLLATLLGGLTVRLPPARAQEEVAGIPSKEIKLPAPKGLKDAPEKSYFLIGPKEGAKEAKEGFGLLVVLPGGDGSREFHNFVKRIYDQALGSDWVAAQPVAIPWARSKDVVWPTKKTPGRGAVPSTEEFVEEVIADVAGRVKVDPARVFLLAWSSSGPPAYSLSLEKTKSVTGFYITMSVFRKDQLPPLAEARGEAYYIEHSTGDKVCPFALAKEAEKLLGAAGARVKFATYDGGHGWVGAVYDRVREGISWLEKNHAPPDKKLWAARAKAAKKK
jgi:predicted esterase